uniref:Glyco_hydro_38C domain-containing protein n=1 Tax=Bursaphelenchus xylophilus TaxID=6326 RepID=A0A1I7S6Z6_BURXY
MQRVVCGRRRRPVRMKAYWWRVLHPTRWRSLVLVVLCFSASLVVYKSITVTKSINDAMQFSNQKYEQLLNDSYSPFPAQFPYFGSLLENECKFPSLLPWENDISFRVAGPLSCTKNMPDIVTLDEENVLSIHDDLDEKWKRRKAKIRCTVSKLSGGLRPKNTEMHEIPTNLTLYMDSRTKIDMDQFVVRCFETPQTGKNETKKDEYKIYQRPFAGYAKQGVSLFNNFFGKETSKYRGYNLFRELVPTTRTCLDAGIPENFCLCMPQDPLPRIERNSTKFQKMEEAIRSKLAEYECLDPGSLKIEENELRTHAINDAARKGMRNMPLDETEEPPKMFKEHRFIYPRVTVATKTASIRRLLFEVKFYTKAERMNVISDPVFINEDNKPSQIAIEYICRIP